MESIESPLPIASTSVKKKRGRPKGSPNKTPRTKSPRKVPVKFMMPRNDLVDDEHLRSGGEDYLPKNFKLKYNGEPPGEGDVVEMEEGSGKEDIEEEHEVDLDTGDEIIVKPESSVLSPKKPRRLSTDSASSNLALANKAEDVEVELISAITRTLQLVSPEFITSENCDNVLKLISNENHVEKIQFGYFFFVTVDEKEHVEVAIKDFSDAGYESVAYCHECIFSTDAALAKHKDKCKNIDDLNRLCKVVVSETPKFPDIEKVFLVYCPNLVLLSDVEHLKSISKHTILLSFSKFCFIECKSMLNSLNIHKKLHDNDKHNFGPEVGPLKCYKVNSTFNYQTYSARSPFKGKAKVSKERETMRKTLDLYELQDGDHNKALLLLGQAVKTGNKSKSSRSVVKYYLIFVIVLLSDS